MYQGRRPVQVLDDAAVEEDGPDPFPQPRNEDDIWMQRQVEEARARLAQDQDWLRREVIRNERAMNQRPDRPEPVPRIHLGVGRNGLQQVGIWDAVMRRYIIRDEE